MEAVLTCKQPQSQEQLDHPPTWRWRLVGGATPCLTVVVAGRHHPAPMLRLTVLSDDAEAQQVAVATGDVQRRVPAVVHQRGVAAGRQQVQTHTGLVCYHGQVERSLGGETRSLQEGKEQRKPGKTHTHSHTCLWWFCRLRKSVLRDRSIMVLMWLLASWMMARWSSLQTEERPARIY